MIVAVASQKGGTGKTSTAVSLASGLARSGKHVLLVDVDSQANSSKVLMPDYLRLKRDDTVCRSILTRQPLPIHPTSIPQLDIVPSHILLSNTDVELTTAKDHREARLKDQLDRVSGESWRHAALGRVAAGRPYRVSQECRGSPFRNDDRAHVAGIEALQSI